MRFKPEKTLKLASRLEREIKEKKLKAGDPFFNAVDAARYLGVSLNVANRALQLLSKRGLLVRRQRTGSFIANPNALLTKQASLDQVHFIIAHDLSPAERPLLDGILFGLQNRLSRTGVNFDILPFEQAEEFTAKLIAESLKSPQNIGFILIRAPLNVAQMIEHSGLPAVVVGFPPPTVSRLAYADRDLKLVASLAADFLQENDCRRCLIVLRNKLLQGDHVMLDNLMEQLGRIGFKASDVAVRLRELNYDLMEADLTSYLSKEEGKVGVFFHPTPFCDLPGQKSFQQMLTRAIKAARPKAPPEVILSDPAHHLSKDLVFPHLLIDMSPEARGEQIADLLEEAAGHSDSTSQCRLLPSVLVLPKTRKKRQN